MNDDRKEMCIVLIILICLAIMVIATAMAMFARREEWKSRAAAPGAHVLVIPSDVASSIPALGGAVPLWRVLAMGLELLPATRVGTHRHLQDYTAAEKKMQMALGFTIDIPNVIRYYVNVTSANGNGGAEKAQF
jgi:hypothetical protein